MVSGTRVLNTLFNGAVLRARVNPYLYGASVRSRSRHYGNLCFWYHFVRARIFLTAWSTVAAVYAGG